MAFLVHLSENKAKIRKSSDYATLMKAVYFERMTEGDQSTSFTLSEPLATTGTSEAARSDPMHLRWLGGAHSWRPLLTTRLAGWSWPRGRRHVPCRPVPCFVEGLASWSLSPSGLDVIRLCIFKQCHESIGLLRTWWLYHIIHML